MEITLTDAEQYVARVIANLRTTNNRKANTHNCNNSDRPDIELDLEGFAGELAFCRLFNVFPDFTSDNRSALKGQDNGDCVLQGKRIDVKTTNSTLGYARVNERKRGCADVFAFMHGKFPNFRFIGFVAHDVIFSQWNRKVFDNRDVVYSVPVTALVKSIDEL